MGNLLKDRHQAQSGKKNHLTNFHNRVPLPSVLTRLHILALTITSMFTLPPVVAAEVSIAAGGNLNTYTPANGDVWTLQGNALLSDGINPIIGKVLPSTLSMNGIATGSTIMMNDGNNHYGYFSGNTTLLNLSNIAFSGGNGSNGGVINTTGDLTLNNTGTNSLVFDSNKASNGGGAIYTSSGNTNVIGGVSMTGNSTAGNVVGGGGGGGAIFAINGNVSVSTTNGNALFTNNTAIGHGGAISANQNITIGNSSGVVTITGNKAGFNADGSQANTIGSGGGLNTSISGGVIVIIGSSITISSNTASGFGGGIRANGGLVITGNLVANNNKALNGSGGAFYTNTGDVNVNGNVSMDRNSAAGLNPTGGSGGAIRSVGGNVNLALTEGSVSLTNNSAAFFGGAISSGSSNITIGNDSAIVTITGNKAGFNADGSQANTTSHGGAVSSNASVAITGSTITLSNNQATLEGGAGYSAGNFLLNANGTAIITNNIAGGKGGALWGGGNVALNANGGDISFSGNRGGGSIANAIYLNNTGSSATASFDASAGRKITFFDPIENNTAKGLISVLKTGAGMLSFDGVNYSSLSDRQSNVYGVTQVEAGTFEVANNAVYGVRAADVGQAQDSSFIMAPSTILQGGSAGTINADLIDIGSNVTLNIAGRQPARRGVFTLNGGSLSFGAGSQVQFNTELNDGTVQNTDLLVINQATVSGAAEVKIKNNGGTGALTVGDGIMLVNATNGATTSADTFKLSGRVVTGAYEYDLYQGGVGANVGNGNWYLRTITSSPRPETGIYLRNLTAASTMFMHTLHDRLGEPQFTNTNKAEENGKATSLWMRVVGNKTDSQAAGGAIDLTTTTSLIHIGGDLIRWSSNDNDRWHFGILLMRVKSVSG